MEWYTNILAVYLPNISGARFKLNIHELLFMEEPNVHFLHGDGCKQGGDELYQAVGCLYKPQRRQWLDCFLWVYL
jgi:hypothetical protein